MVQDAIKAFDADQSKWIAAICAAPLALRAAGIAKGSRVTCYPGLEGDVCADAHFICDSGQAASVTDGHLITSRGPGTAYDFALTIVEHLKGSETRTQVAKDCLLI